MSAKKPKLPAFVDGKDDLDAYLARFERTATANGWPREDWATNLSALLTGRALNVYSRLNERDANDYFRLKEALLQRYGLTAEGYRRKLRESGPEPDESPSQYIERLSGYLRRWVNLAGTDIEDLILYEQFMATCPKPLQTHLKERVNFDLEELGRQAAKYLEAHGRSLHSWARHHAATDEESSPPSRSHHHGSTMALPAAIQEVCVFCSCPHPADDCRKVRDLTPAERRERVMRRGGCFWCLKPFSHRAADCGQSRPRCSVCNGRHHQLLCDRSAAVTGEARTSVKRMPSAQPAMATATRRTAAEHRSGVLMQTARGDAAGPNGTRRVRVMCDSGSNATFIRSDIADKLGCKVLNREPLRVNTFGNGQTSHQASDKVSVGLATKDGSWLHVIAHTVPRICGPPPVISQVELQQHEHLRGLALAEGPSQASADGDEIDILIGQDFLQDVYTGEMRVDQSGPMMINSRFGWMLCGRSGGATSCQVIMTNLAHQVSGGG